MNERFFYITVFVLIVITILGVFTLFKNSNQLAKSDKNSQVLSLVGDRSVKNLNEENIEDMKKKDENKKPDFILDNNKNYQAKLTTSEGEIVINLNTKETPRYLLRTKKKTWQFWSMPLRSLERPFGPNPRAWRWRSDHPALH